jgi:NAD+ diphosphatase
LRTRPLIGPGGQLLSNGEKDKSCSCLIDSLLIVTGQTLMAAKPVAPQPIRKAWKFCPRCGVAAAKKGRNPFRCEPCGFTQYFGPVSAVGAIATDPNGQVLLLVRAKDPGKGLYGLPGGFIDAGETAEEALHREVLEEVQLQVTSYRYLVSFPNEYNFQGFVLPVTDMFFVIEVESFDSLSLLDGEIDAWHFCHPEKKELQRMAFESNRMALEMFLSHRKK